MESENFWFFGSFRNGILFFAVGWVVAFGDGYFTCLYQLSMSCSSRRCFERRRWFSFINVIIRSYYACHLSSCVMIVLMLWVVKINPINSRSANRVCDNYRVQEVVLHYRIILRWGGSSSSCRAVRGCIYRWANVLWWWGCFGRWVFLYWCSHRRLESSSSFRP